MRDRDSLILENIYFSMLFESIEDQQRQSHNLLIANVVGRDIWKNKNKPENKETIEKARIETEPVYKRILSIVEPYQSDQYAKNMAHLPELTKFYLQVKDLNLIEKEYKSYMSLGSLKAENTIKKEQDFLKWSAKIHRLEEIERVKKEGQVETPKEDKVVSGDDNMKYEDENVIVFLANNVNDPNQSVKNCIKYGKGSRLCISGSSARTSYHAYRWNHKLTTYFIWLKAENRYILVDAGEEDGEYQYNNVEENDDIEASKEDIIEEYPVLKKPFDAGVFVSIPIEGKELEFYTKFYNARSIRDFDNLDDRLNYANFGKISNDDFESLPEEHIPIVLKTYIEGDLEDDIKEELLNKYPALKKRYWQKKIQNLEREFQEWSNGDIVSFSDDEWKLIINQNIDVPQNVMEKILRTSSSVLAYQYLRNNKQVPIELEDNILKLPSSGLAYLQYLIKHGVGVSEMSLIKVLEKSKEDYIMNVCRVFIRNEEEIPEYFIDSLSQNPKTSFEYVTLILTLDSKNIYSRLEEYRQDFEYIPKNILNSILTNPTTTFDLLYRYVIPIYVENIPQYLLNSEGYSGMDVYQLEELMRALINYALQMSRENSSYKFNLKKVPVKMMESVSSKHFVDIYPNIIKYLILLSQSEKDSFRILNHYFESTIIRGGSDAIFMYLKKFIPHRMNLSEIPEKMMDVLMDSASASREFASYLVEKGVEIPDKLYDAGKWNERLGSRELEAEDIRDYIVYADSFLLDPSTLEKVKKTIHIVKNRPEMCLDLIHSIIVRIYGASEIDYLGDAENEKYNINFEKIPEALINGVLKNQKTKKKLNEITINTIQSLNKRISYYNKTKLDQDIDDKNDPIGKFLNNFKSYLESLYEKSKETLSESYIGLKTFKKFVSNRYT